MLQQQIAIVETADWVQNMPEYQLQLLALLTNAAEGCGNSGSYLVGLQLCQMTAGRLLYGKDIDAKV